MMHRSLPSVQNAVKSVENVTLLFQNLPEKNTFKENLATSVKRSTGLKGKARGAALALVALGLTACAQEGAKPALSSLEVTSAGQHELIFSSITGTSSEAQTVTLKNTGDAPLTLSTLGLSGPDVGVFELNAPGLPLVLEPGGDAAASVSFAPPASGTRHATLEIDSSADSAVAIGLYGLGSQGDGVADEPSLQQVVDTLGYGVNVGDELSATGNTPTGDEVAAPLFGRAGGGPVTLTVVARYGPGEALPYGIFTLQGAEPQVQAVGQVAATDAQKLLPPLETGNAPFDPAAELFGVYAGTGDDVRYSLDGLNPGSAHALRVYPLHDRSGEPVADSYLLSLEAGDDTRDFQDALFVLSNVRLGGASPDQGAPETAAGWEPLFNGVDLSGWYSYLPSKGTNNDSEGVFRAENGELHVLGVEDSGGHREFGYLATEKSYANYHLRLEYRWGDERFAPRDRSKRDSGVVYHVSGPDTVWPRGVEYQIQEGDTGDLWLLSGTTVQTTVESARAKEPQFAQNGTPYTSRGGRFVRIAKDATHEQAGWNTVDIIVRGNTAVHMINGQVNNRAYALYGPDGEALGSGKILLQAEGAEVFYRNVQIQQLE